MEEEEKTIPETKPSNIILLMAMGPDYNMNHMWNQMWNNSTDYRRVEPNLKQCETRMWRKVQASDTKAFILLLFSHLISPDPWPFTSLERDSKTKKA